MSMGSSFARKAKEWARRCYSGLYLDVPKFVCFYYTRLHKIWRNTHIFSDFLGAATIQATNYHFLAPFYKRQFLIKMLKYYKFLDLRYLSKLINGFCLLVRKIIMKTGDIYNFLHIQGCLTALISQSDLSMMV